MCKSERTVFLTPLTSTFNYLFAEHEGTLKVVSFQYPHSTTNFMPQLTLNWKDGYSVNETFIMSPGDSFENWIGQLVIHLCRHGFTPKISELDMSRASVEILIVSR